MHYTNESDFDARLAKIGALYEEGKECLHGIAIDWSDEREVENQRRLQEILSELRHIAAMQLKAGHVLRSN